MAKFSPKLEIINHFDNLINRIDIDIEESLEKYNKDEVLGKIRVFTVRNRYINWQYFNFYTMRFYDSSLDSLAAEYILEKSNWSESTNVHDYLNQVRTRTIRELRKAQEDTLEYYKENLDQFKAAHNQPLSTSEIDEMKSRLFGGKFYFQVLIKPFQDGAYHRSWVYNLFTLVTDFYMSPSDITLLQKFENSEITSEDRRGQKEDKIIDLEPELILDEKVALIGLIHAYICLNLTCVIYPKHVIHIRKEDLLKIKEIVFCYNNLIAINLTGSTIDLSKLECLEIVSVYKETKELILDHFTSLQSLELKLKSVENYSFGKFDSLQCLNLTIESEIKSEMISLLIEKCPNIESLSLYCENLRYFSLENSNNLKYLYISGEIKNKEDFNMDLFETICNNLIGLTIRLRNIDDEFINKLICGHNFENLSNLIIYFTEITRIEKKLFDGFPVLESLNLSNNEKLETIDSCAFSNLNRLEDLSLGFNNLTSLHPQSFIGLSNLTKLDLSKNNLTHLEPQVFKDLVNLEDLDLSRNKLTHFDLSILQYIGKINRIELSENPIKNKKEILDHCYKEKFSF